MTILNVNFRFTDDTPAESGQGSTAPEGAEKGGGKSPDIPSPATDRPSEEKEGKGGKEASDKRPKKTSDDDKAQVPGLTDAFVDALKKTGIQDATKGTLLDGISKIVGRMGDIATTLGKTPGALIAVGEALGFSVGAASGTGAGAATRATIISSKVISSGTGLAVRGTTIAGRVAGTTASTGLATTAAGTGAAAGTAAFPVVGTLVGLVAGFIVGKIVETIIGKAISTVTGISQNAENIAQRTALFNPQVIAQNAQFAVQRLNRNRRIAERYGEGLALSSRVHGSLRHFSEGIADIPGLIFSEELQNIFGGGIPKAPGVSGITAAVLRSFEAQVDLLKNLRGKNAVGDFAFDPLLGFQSPIVDFAPALPTLTAPINTNTIQTSSATGQNAKIPNIGFQAP